MRRHRTLFAGNRRVVSYFRVVFDLNDELGLDGFLTFVHVDQHGRPLPHRIVIDAVDPEEIRLREMAKSLHPGASPQG